MHSDHSDLSAPLARALGRVDASTERREGWVRTSASWALGSWQHLGETSPAGQSWSWAPSRSWSIYLRA